MPPGETPEGVEDNNHLQHWAKIRSHSSEESGAQETAWTFEIRCSVVVVFVFLFHFA